jgi:hypothetical protein
MGWPALPKSPCTEYLVHGHWCGQCQARHVWRGRQLERIVACFGAGMREARV